MPPVTNSFKTLLWEDRVAEALRVDEGSGSQMTSWKLENFPGQGATSVIKRIRVKFTKGGEQYEKSYISKMNLGSTMKAYEKKNQMYFKKEEAFYNHLAPIMREVLGGVQRSLKTPRCFYSETYSGRELTIMEDLTSQEFRVARCVPKHNMDVAHALLVVRELASFHSSSLLAEMELKEPIETRFPVVRENWFEGYPHREVFEEWWSMQVQIVIDLAEKERERYKEQCRWLKSVKGNVTDALLQLAKPSHPKFALLIHNDSWHNNILFRYDEKNNPKDVMLVDLQMTTKASPVIDLIFFMFISMRHEDRKQHWRELLTTYYNCFSAILKDSGETPPFSLAELTEEFLKKIGYGVLFSIAFSSSWFLLGDERVATPLNEVDLEAYPENHRKATMRVLAKPKDGQLLKDLYLRLLDDLKDDGGLSRLSRFFDNNY